MSSKIYSVCTSAAGELLCEHGTPVFNLTRGAFITQAEMRMELGAARPAKLVEVFAYRRHKSPHSITDLNRG